MTAKRFDCFEDKWGSRTITDNGKCIGAETVVKILNELYEENTMLKERRHEDINELSVIAMRFKALEKENERLRRCINGIYTIARLEEVD